APLELTCEEDLADLGFFTGGLSSIERGLVSTRRGALAWSAFGNSHIDLETGVVTALPRWERPTPAASAVALDADFALMVRNGRAGVIHNETGKEVADFTHWLGDIRAVRALAPGRLLVLDGENNALFWDVERSGNDFARVSVQAALRPFRATAAATL